MSQAIAADAPALVYDVAPVAPDELHLLLNSWKESNEKPYRRRHNVGRDDYYRIQGAVCDEMLARFPTVLVARAPSGLALGWVCGEATDAGVVIHYAYTKRDYREHGIGRRLYAAVCAALAPHAGVGLYQTHWSRFEPVARRYGSELRSSRGVA